MMGSWRGVVTVAVGLIALVHCSDSGRLWTSLALYQVDNVFIHNIFSTNSFGADVRVSNSRRVSLFDCFFDGT